MSNSVSDDHTLEAYYTDVRGSELLSAEAERALFVQYRTCTKCKWQFPIGKPIPVCTNCHTKRNYRPRDKLIEGALRFVIKVAKDYARQARGLNYETDVLKALISAGNLGLLVAVDRFDLNMGTRFLTYAAWWIREKIREELDNSGLVRVPAYRQKALRLRRRMGETIEHDAAYILLESSSSIDVSQSDDQLERNLVNTYGSEMVHVALTELGFRGRDRYIILAYFGVREEPKNLRQISSRLNLSSERVRQIKQDVLTQLKGHLESKRIRDSEDVFTE
jgi:RNA polymerase sigma factor (sigma-70 family)